MDLLGQVVAGPWSAGATTATMMLCGELVARTAVRRRPGRGEERVVFVERAFLTGAGREHVHVDERAQTWVVELSQNHFDDGDPAPGAIASRHLCRILMVRWSSQSCRMNFRR